MHSLQGLTPAELNNFEQFLNLYHMNQRTKYIIQHHSTDNTKEVKKRTLFHYTSIEKLNKILECKEIKITTKFIESNLKPAVWLSNNPNYAEHPSLEGMARIEIQRPPDMIPWEKFKYSNGISKEQAERMEQVGISQGVNPSDWYARYTPIYSKLWVVVEVYKNGHWILYEKAKAFNAHLIKEVRHENKKRMFI